MIKYNKYLKNKKGFTLIEVILSIAILGIISIAFLSMFTSGIVGISNSGKKSESHYTAQSDIEIKINDFKKPPDKNPISLIFLDENSDIANNYNVNGRKINVIYKYGRIDKILTTFTTNYKK